jgi:predicted AlkP superfamily phosphohydrolase/phosphomutase
MLRLIAPAVVVAALLLPSAAAWLDAARALGGERYAYRAPARRVVVLGFDGVDYSILQEYVDRLPEIARLAREGAFRPCRTTNPPESPVAWATFATGLDPSGHRIYDFVRRDVDAADGYRPLNGMVAAEPPELGPFGFPLRPPRAHNLRRGEGFWEPVARRGYRVSVLRMPLTFPAELPRGGELLCGLGVPDLRATQGSYTLYAAGRDAWEGFTEFGGRHLKLYPRNGKAESILEGPPDPRAGGKGPRLCVPVRFGFAGRSTTISVGGGAAVALEPGLFSRWVPVRFRAGPLVSIEGVIRFLLLQGGDEAAIYASPIQIAPHAPILPISAPRAFAAQMAKDVDLMRTAGWPEDTFAANDRVLDDVQIYREILDVYRGHERLCLDRLDRSGAALLAMIFTAQDRIAHMFFRYRDKEHPAHDPAAIAAFAERTGVEDPIFESYRWMNDTIAEVRKRLAPDDVLLIVSDHGFHSWRHGFNLNTWLAREGYLVPADAEGAGRARDLESFFRRSSETSHIDWGRTRAYALGLGQIFVNLRGREQEGIVDPADRRALLEEIRAKLAGVVGPDGRKVFTATYVAEDTWRAPQLRDAPDLQCAFAAGYRVSWQTALLGVPPGLFELNDCPWSGDHCSNDAAETPGIFLSNVPLADGDEPDLLRIAPTVCALFDAPPPPGADAPPLRLLLPPDR